MYTFNTYNNSLWKTVGDTKVEVLQDENNAEYQDYLVWQSENGNPPTFEEIDLITWQKEKLKEVYSIYDSIYYSALALSIEKVEQGLTKQNLELLREEYLDKYLTSVQHLSESVVSNLKMLSELEKECERDFAGDLLNDECDNFGLDKTGTRLTKFCRIVIFKYNYSQEIWEYLKALSSKVRTTLITDLEKGQIEKYNSRLAVVLSITNETNLIQIQALEAVFEAI
jgi:hypothetical protein